MLIVVYCFWCCSVVCCCCLTLFCSLLAPERCRGRWRKQPGVYFLDLLPVFSLFFAVVCFFEHGWLLFEVCCCCLVGRTAFLVEEFCRGRWRKRSGACFLLLYWLQTFLLHLVVGKDRLVGCCVCSGCCCLGSCCAILSVSVFRCCCHRGNGWSSRLFFACCSFL